MERPDLPLLPEINWQQPDWFEVLDWRGDLALRLQRMDQEQRGALRAFYSEEPALWISHWGYTFDPRNADRGLPSTVPFVLFPKQRDYIAWLHERWKGREDGVVEKSRDMGVSWLCVGFAAWMWVFKPGSVVGFGSRKEDLVDHIGDPDSLFWKVRAFIDLLPADFKPTGYDKTKHAPFMRVMNPANEAVIRGESGDNIGRGGRTSIYFKDEAAYFERPDSIDASLSQTTNCQIDVSTPNGEGNPFWRKRFGGKLPVFVFDWRDDPRKSQAWYDEQKAKRDPTVIAQELDRDYSASIGNSFIGSDLVTAAMARGPADVPAMGPIRAGLDVARFGDDKCVLTIRRGRVVVRQTVWGKTDLMSTAGRVKQELQSYQQRGLHLEQIAVDTIGVGAGVADALRAWFGEDTVADVNVSSRMSDGQNYNLRAWMWSQMRDWLATAAIPNDTDLRADLTGLRYSYRGGELLLEAKDDAKKRGMRSPDRGDSLALTFAVPGGAKPKKSIPSHRVVSYAPDAELGL